MDAETVEVDLEIPQGDLWTKELFFKLPNGDPWDVSNYTFSSSVRRRTGISATNPVLAVFTFDTSILGDATIGFVIMSISEVESTKLLERCVSDCRVEKISPVGGPWTWFRWHIHSPREVTDV